MAEPNEVDERQVLDATREVIDRVFPFGAETRRRIFRAAITTLGLDGSLGFRPAVDNPSASAQPTTSPTASQGLREPRFADRAELPPKEFLVQKQPETDLERAVCLAYYLTHYRDIKHFKTLDISKLNTEAAQVKFSNPASTVTSAGHVGLLVPAGKGFKQLSTLGEQFVEALPDRVAAREIVAKTRARRSRKTANRMKNLSR